MNLVADLLQLHLQLGAIRILVRKRVNIAIEIGRSVCIREELNIAPPPPSPTHTHRRLMCVCLFSFIVILVLDMWILHPLSWCLFFPTFTFFLLNFILCNCYFRVLLLFCTFLLKSLFMHECSCLDLLASHLLRFVSFGFQDGVLSVL